MKQIQVVSMALGVVALLLAGCASEQQMDEPARGMAMPVEILDYMTGSDAALDQSRVLLVQSQGQLEEVAGDALAGLKIDFAVHSVVVLALGERATGGWWASITGLQRDGGLLYVQGTANKPGPDEMVTEALTYPFAAAVIPKTTNVQLVPEIDSVVGQPAPMSDAEMYEMDATEDVGPTMDAEETTE